MMLWTILSLSRLLWKNYPYGRKNLPFNDAPPCVQTTYLVEGKFSEDFENIKVYNDAMGVESDNEFTEPYKCENCQFCNKEVCKTRKYKA